MVRLLLGEQLDMLAAWDERKESLEMMLEVYTFARNAAIAECWLTSQEPYLHNRDIGVCNALLCSSVFCALL